MGEHGVAAGQMGDESALAGAADKAGHALAHLPHHGADGIGDACMVRQDHPRAQNNLAFMYGEGRGYAQDWKKAAEWYERAALQNYAIAQYNLGYLYETGKGVGQNYTTAADWYRRAAEQNEPAAMYSLGLLYDQGNGVERNLHEAYRWYQQAAAAGDPDAKQIVNNQKKQEQKNRHK